MAKNTYATTAKNILNKYKTRLGKDLDLDDPLAKTGLDLEMRRLVDNQEAAREDLGIRDGEPIMKKGGKLPKKQRGSYLDDPPGYNPFSRDFDIVRARNPQAAYDFRNLSPMAEIGSPQADTGWIRDRGVNEGTPREVGFQNRGSVPMGAQTRGRKTINLIGGNGMPRRVPTEETQEEVESKETESQETESQRSRPKTNNTQTRSNVRSSRGPATSDRRAMSKLTPYPTDYAVTEQAKDEADLAWALNYANTGDPNIDREQSELELRIPDVEVAPPQQGGQSSANEYYNPTVSPIPLAASVAGNLLMAGMNDAEEVSYDRMTPEEINLGAQREQAKRRSQTTTNQTARNIKGLGMSPGASANLMVSSQADIDANLGREIAESYLQEEMTNAGFRDTAERANTDIAMREAEANARERDVANQVNQQAMQSIIADVGSYFGDVSKAKRYNNLYQQMPGTAKLYQDPEQSRFNRIFLGSRPIVRHDPNITKTYR